MPIDLGHLARLIAPLLAALPLVGASPASAQSFDGRWSGTISCAKLSFTPAMLNTPIAVTVRGGRAQFSRTVLSPDGRLKVGTETGSGSVDASGATSLSGGWRGRADSYQSSYSGRLSAAGGTLSGTQLWQTGDGQRHNRDCSITLHR